MTNNHYWILYFAELASHNAAIATQVFFQGSTTFVAFKNYSEGLKNFLTTKMLGVFDKIHLHS
jgi:hypothetical protein